MGALDDFNNEADFNEAEGEMSVTFTLILGSQRISMQGYESDAWSRKEVDGRLSPEQPLWAPSVVVPLSLLLDAGITTANYDSLQVERSDGSIFSVISHAGADPVRFFLKMSSSDSGSSVEPDIDIDTDIEPS